MNVFKVKNHEEMGAKAAAIIAGQVVRKKDSILGLATGSTPLTTYAKVIEMYKEGILDFSEIKSFNLDEYVGIDKENDQSYYYFMFNELFNHINIKEENIQVPDGKQPLEKIEQYGKDYDAAIRAAGGIDLQLLGIGNNGHIGFNEPADELIYNTHLEKLTDSTIEANSRFFEKKEDVPTHAISMGIGTIMESKSILLLGSKGKKDIVEKMINGPVTPQVPASLLQLHPDVTVIYVG